MSGELKPWAIEYNNDTGSNDEGFWEWWDVTDGDISFKANTEESAKFLCEKLNATISKPYKYTEHSDWWAVFGKIFDFDKFEEESSKGLFNAARELK